MKIRYVGVSQARVRGVGRFEILAESYCQGLCLRHEYATGDLEICTTTWNLDDWIDEDLVVK